MKDIELGLYCTVVLVALVSNVPIVFEWVSSWRERRRVRRIFAEVEKK